MSAKNLVLGSLAAAMLAGSANAAVITLASVTPTGANYAFTYEATLGQDEGIKSGDQFVIYDFTGYVAGSIFAPTNFTTSTALTTPGAFVPGESDDPTLTNLIFTYNGPTFRTTGGPLRSFSYENLGAVSTLQTTHLDAFQTSTVKNNPVAAAGTTVLTQGETQVPGGVPEPASWVMLVLGFGLVGTFRRRVRQVAA